MHYYTDIITHGRPCLTSHQHWWEQMIESHLSVTSGSGFVRTWTTRLTERDANNCAISPPPVRMEILAIKEAEVLIIQE